MRISLEKIKPNASIERSFYMNFSNYIQTSFFYSSGLGIKNLVTFNLTPIHRINYLIRKFQHSYFYSKVKGEKINT